MTIRKLKSSLTVFYVVQSLSKRKLAVLQIGTYIFPWKFLSLQLLSKKSTHFIRLLYTEME